MSIRPIQEAFNRVSTFEELKKFTDNAEVKLSFWGCDYFTVQGYQGYLKGLDVFTIGLMKLVKNRNYEFNETERALGKEIRNKIDKIYENQRKLYVQSRFITKIFNYVRKTSADILNDWGFKSNVDLQIRYDWKDERDNELFELYTYDQHIAVFGVEPKGILGWADVGRSNMPDRWYSPEWHDRQRV